MANGLGGLIDDQSFDDVYHTTKFLEDVSMLMSVEIGRCEMTVRDVLAPVSYTHLPQPTRELV